MTVVVTHGDTGEGVVEEVRELMGPADVDLAKQDAPDRYIHVLMSDGRKKQARSSKK